MMQDITFISAFPKSGITYLNYMLFHVVFDRPQDAGKIDSDYIFDLHENLNRVPAPGDAPRYVKSHLPYSAGIPLRQRASRAVYLWRDPIDVMMSIWDFKHLMGEDGLLDASPAEEEGKFQLFCKHWITSGGMVYPFAGSWFGNVSSWLDQTDVPTLVVDYRRLKARPFEEVKRILRFLGVEAADERVKHAVEAGRPRTCASSKPMRSTGELPAFFIVPGWREGIRADSVSSAACTRALPTRS